MKKSLIALSLALVFMAPHAHALSCLPIEDYLESVVKDDETRVFEGTATEVTKNHTQVVTVSEAHKGWVPREVWVNHPWSSDWQYFCSNGPAKPGEKTVFIATIDQHGLYSVTQTLDANSELAKDFIAALEDAGADAGISEATSRERADEILLQVGELLKTLMHMLSELAYWQNK